MAPAQRHLRQLYLYIAKDQPVNAQRFVDRLAQRAEKIAEQPQAGLRVQKYRRDDVRQVIEGEYRIVYRILPDRIDILTVRHKARLWPGRLRDL